MRGALALAFVLTGCDVVVSVGDHDVGADAVEHGDTGSDAPLLDTPFVDVGADDAGEHDAGVTCHAADAGACQACRASSCCEALVLCEAAPFCLCLADCIPMSTLADCITHCGGMDHGEHDALLACSTGPCAASCP